MEVQYTHCCGIDIHKKSITVCVLIRESGRREQKHLHEFGTMTSEILACVDWLGQLESHTWRWNPRAFTGSQSGI